MKNYSVFLSNENPRVEIEMMDGGKMELELFPKCAPITVNNFLSLIDKNFYDSLIFHRVIENFMIQTGDPTGSGSFGSDETIKGEFAINGVNNDISHVRGVLSMARKGPSAGEEETSETMDSASSQFFICHKAAGFLDGSYAAFGVLVNGLDVLDKIATTKTDASDRPLEDMRIKTIKRIR